jgi:NitT/TauT family transport system substrate-binding protein
MAGAGEAEAAGKLKVGQVYVWLGDIPQYVAQEKGFYKAKGLDVELTTFRGGGEVANALVGGTVDIAIGALDHVIKMQEKGLDAAAFLVIQDKLGFTMFAKKGAGIKAVGDLKGKVLVTSAPGSSADNYMRYLLAKGGLDPLKDVTIIAGGGNEGRVAALKQGSALAAAVTEPATSIILAEGIGDVLHRGTDWDYPFNVAIAKKEFLAKNRDTIKAFVEATLEGVRFSRANPEQAEEVALKIFAKGDPKIIRQAVRNYLPTFSESGVAGEQSVKFVTDLLLEAKVIKRAVPMSSFWDPSFLPKR